VEPTDENLRAWDDAHRRRGGPARGDAALPEQVRQSVADLHGKRVLHLHCGTGAASAEFAELGASVTAVDASEALLDVGRERAPSVLWIAAEPDALPAELQRGRFDLVYAGPDTHQSLRDLELFAGNVAASLRAGGDLLMFDEHPAALCVDGLMHWREDYFTPGFHRLGQLVGALARHHLAVRALEEYPAGAGSFHDQRVPGTFLLHARKSRER
jgi:SAM-dependent methyltransferase